MWFNVGGGIDVVGIGGEEVSNVVELKNEENDLVNVDDNVVYGKGSWV